MLFKALHSANNWKWIDILPAIIYNHNHTINKQISDRNHQLTPYDVYIRGRKSYEKKVPFVDNLAIGDYVRIRAIEPDSTEAAFKKKTREQKYSQTVYRIIGRDGVRYMLTKPETLLIINKSYLPRQLLKVSRPNEITSIRDVAKATVAKNNYKKIKKDYRVEKLLLRELS